jgi:hypothetical protein
MAPSYPTLHVVSSKVLEEAKMQCEMRSIKTPFEFVIREVEEEEGPVQYQRSRGWPMARRGFFNILLEHWAGPVCCY